MKVDHVSFGGSSLSSLDEEFTAAGMKPVYGGPHSGGITHMSLIGFRDGSYFELISTVGPGLRAPNWSRQIEGDGGPCAWAIGVDDIGEEVAKAKRAGIPASGPGDYSRTRPDGVKVEWQLGFLGEGEAGSILPFMIKDKTPREYRVKPSPSVSGPGSHLSGVERVVLGVEDLEEGIALFRRMYDWKEPERAEGLMEGTVLAAFRGTPVVLASPKGSSWLATRLRRFGPSPCAYVLRTDDLALAEGRLQLDVPVPWLEGSRLAWVGPLKRRGILVGVTG